MPASHQMQEAGMSFPTSTTIPSSTGLRLRCLARRIHGLGPRTLYELMCALSTSATAMPVFEQFGALAIYGDVIEAYGGRDLPPTLTLIKR